MPRLILIADDSTISLSIMKKLVSSLCPDKAVIGLTTTYGMLDILTQNDCDVLLTDLVWLTTQVDKEKGLHLIEAVREHERYSNVGNLTVVIAFSGDTNLRERALSLGANYFISKPVTKDELRRVFTAFGII